MEALRRRVRGARSRRRNPTRARSRDSGIRAIVRPFGFHRASLPSPALVGFFFFPPLARLSLAIATSPNAPPTPPSPPSPPRAPSRRQLGIQSPEELAADVAEALRKPGQSAKQYLEKVDEHRERFGFEDTDGLSAALKTAVAEIEKKTGQTLMVDDEAGMAKLAETVAPLVENVMSADEDALESASIEEAAAEELAELAELKKSMRPPQIDAKTGQPKERATTEQIVARAKEAIESGRLKPAQAESLRKLLAQGQ